MTMPLSTSAVCSTTVPTGLTGLISPRRGTGTNSMGMPQSTQSIRFWEESSFQRRGLVGQTVKMLMGRRRRSSRSSRNRAMSSPMRGTPVGVNAPETMGRGVWARRT